MGDLEGKLDSATTGGNSLQAHWESVYQSKPDERLGWFEHDAATTLSFLRDIPLRDRVVLLPGAGTTVLARALLDRGASLVLNDLSATALQRLIARDQLDPARVECRIGDLGAQASALHLPACDLWIDRAVLHFLRSEDERANYFARLRESLRPGGFAMFAEFAPGGATTCSNLPIHPYSADDLQLALGSDFRLIDARAHTHLTPSGSPRPYTYALFERR